MAAGLTEASGSALSEGADLYGTSAWLTDLLRRSLPPPPREMLTCPRTRAWCLGAGLQGAGFGAGCEQNMCIAHILPPEPFQLVSEP